MRTAAITAAIVGAILLVAGCSANQGAESDEPASTPTASAGESIDDSGDHVEALGGSTVPFDQTFEYEDGLSLTVSQPETFKPSRRATHGPESSFVMFTVRMVNDSAKSVSPSNVFVTVESGDAQGGDVLDPKREMSGAPPKPVKPGDRLEWVHGFGVRDPEDVRILVQAGIDREPIAFAG